jgi:uncharacterized protein YcbX
MSNAMQTEIGTVVSLWRYPVKSMIGEELNVTAIGQRGLLGDRAYALVDSSDEKVATAKNPRKWPNLFDCRASFIDPPSNNANLPPVRITLPDGTETTSQRSDHNEVLSNALNRTVTLRGLERGQLAPAKAEEYWPDIEGLDHRDTVTDFALPKDTFFDCATVHLLTTATLDRLDELYLAGRFDVRRFRPNIVIEAVSAGTSFVENGWIGQTLAIGDEIRLRITGPCGRCVMTTLAQGELPRDSGILRTAVQHNQGNVGVYATVLQGGTMRRGDRLVLSR